MSATLAFFILAFCATGIVWQLDRAQRIRRVLLLEAHLRALRAKLRQARPGAGAGDEVPAPREAKSRFLANVSHEIRTPLAGILGMADLLASSQLTAEQSAYAQAIQMSGAALAHLIDDILDFSRIEAGKLELLAEPYDLVAVVEGVVELLAPRAQEKGLEIAVLMAPDTPRNLVGDAARLRQVLTNLIGNAVKFTMAGGIGIEVGPIGGMIGFRILDSGCGVAETRKAAIFEEFEQGGMLSQHAGGTGLGLAIARRLATAMGGSLELARSGPDGSEFICLVPLAKAGTELVSDDNALVALREKILVVAQTRFEAPYLAQRLRAMGMAVELQADPASAMARLAQAPPPATLIVDCALGAAMTQALVLAARQAGIARVLVLFSPHERRALGQNLAGAQGWLVKPLRMQSLRACILGTAAPASARPASAPAASAAHVLLAEDNAINALVATRHLERLGARVTHAGDGLTALALARRAALGETPAFDLILMDLRMPGMDGRDVARHVRQLEAELGHSPTRMVALTADALVPARDECLAAGIDQYLVKPVRFEQLAHLLLSDAPDRLNKAC